LQFIQTTVLPAVGLDLSGVVSASPVAGCSAAAAAADAAVTGLALAELLDDVLADELALAEVLALLEELLDDAAGLLPEELHDASNVAKAAVATSAATRLL
jgi:hypothetical protein